MRTHKSSVKRKLVEHSNQQVASKLQVASKSRAKQPPAKTSASATVSPPQKKMRQEKQHEPAKSSTTPSSESKKEEAKEIIWNDKNCDHDLDDHAASNVHTRKIKISSNLLLSCRMISHLENKHLQQDYAALVFSRKTNKERSFDFMIDLRVTERLIRALEIIVQENPVFFNKRASSSQNQK